jgi:hypothetical protein
MGENHRQTAGMVRRVSVRSFIQPTKLSPTFRFASVKAIEARSPFRGKFARRREHNAAVDATAAHPTG